MEVTATPHVARAPVIDLMQALKNSLAAKPGPVAERKSLVRAVPKAEAETTAKKTKRRAG
jgi:non-homologous end joining protein Ku